MRTVMNPPNPFESQHRDLLEPVPHVQVQIFEDATRDILSRNESPDLPFRWSLNPYRGCFHACAYCYARPTHEYWGFGAGTDFESKIIVKREAATLLRRAFEKPSWKGELILFSGNTDCYQPLEASLELTRACSGRLCRVSESGRDHHERGIGAARSGRAASVASGGVGSCVFQHTVFRR